MKKTRRCPKCDGIDLLYISQPFPDLRSANQAPLDGARLALTRHLGFIRAQGEIEAYCCVGCGFLETYVKNWEGLQPDGAFVVRLAQPIGVDR